MAITLKLRRNANTGVVPTTAQLTLGELAINTFDGRIFFERDNGTMSILELCNTTGTFSGTLAATSGTIDTIPIGRGTGAIGSNLAIGAGALASMVSNTSCLAIGQNSLATAKGGSNIGLGVSSGSNITTGTNNICLGNNTTLSTLSDTNSIVIGNNASGIGNNTTVLGNTSTVLTKIWGTITQPTTINTTAASTFTINNPYGIITCSLTTIITVNNSLVTPNSIVIVTFRSSPSPSTMYVKNVLPGAGSFTINFSATPTSTNPVLSFIVLGTT